MAEEGADALIEVGADDVLELAGVGVGFGGSDGKCVGEQAFGETAATNDIASAIFTARGERYLAFANFEETEILQAGNKALRVMREAVADAIDFGRGSLFRKEPNLFEQVIEANFLFGGKFGDLHEAAVSKIDATVGELADRRIVGDHEDGVAFGVKIAHEADHRLLIRLV